MGIQPRQRRSGKWCVFGLQRKLFHGTKFAGVPVFRRVWEICRIDQRLRELEIVKGGHPAELLTFAYVLGNLVGSRCLRQLTDCWRGDGYLRDWVAAGRRLGAHDWSRLLERFDFVPLLTSLVDRSQGWSCTADSDIRGILILDDTPLEKFGRMMEGAHWVYDNAKQRFVWGYSLVNLFYQHKRASFPVGFRLQIKRGRGRKRKVERTKTTLAMELLKEAARQGLRVRAVVFDAAYCAVKLLRHLDELGYHWITRLKSDRIVEIDGKRFSIKQLSRKRSWFSHDPVRGVDYIVREGYLRDYDLRVQLVLIRTPGVGYQALVTSLIETPWQEIFRLYKRRFKIESFHRDAKQYVGLLDFRYRSLKRITNHVALTYVRYLLLVLMRLAFPELADFSWERIKERVIHNVQQLHVTKDVIRILLPPDSPLFRQLLIRYKLGHHPIAA